MSQTLAIVVAGASSGIGAAVTQALAAAGHTLFVCARRIDRLEAAAAGNVRIRARQCDVAEEPDVQAFVSWVSDQTPAVDALLNCAGGFGAIGPFDKTDSGAWMQTLNVNLFGTYLMSKHLLPLLQRAASPRIINFSGGGAFNPFPNYSAYATSKAAVVRLTECQAAELADRGIAVNALAPGFVATPIHEATIAAGPAGAGLKRHEHTRKLLQQGAVPMEVVVECVQFLLSPAAAHLTGKTISASFDPWRRPDFREHVSEMNASDLYTMRRVNPEHLADGLLKTWLQEPVTTPRRQVHHDIEGRPLAETAARSCVLCHDCRFVPTVFGGYRYRGGEYAIVRCRTCGLMFVDPVPSADVVMDVYEGSEYFDEYRVPGSGTVGYLKGLEDTNPYDETTLALLAEYRPGGRLLDVGCAGGRFLARARGRGYDVAGVEPNPAMAAHARDSLGLDVRLGTLTDVAPLFGDGAFDVIHLADVLEHLLDLDDSLARIRRVLKPGGVVVLQQPVTYNRSLFSLLLRVNMLLKSDRYSPYPPLHVWEFTPATLRRLLAAHGFEVLRLRSFESVPHAAPAASAKQRATSAVKALSSRLSNWSPLSWLELGDRVFVIARKT